MAAPRVLVATHKAWGHVRSLANNDAVSYLRVCSCGLCGAVAASQGFVLSPVLVCKVPTKTVGLGDSISAAGLERSVFLGNGAVH